MENTTTANPTAAPRPQFRLERVEVRPGFGAVVTLGWSEAAVALGVAGRECIVLLTASRKVQLFEVESGDPISFPITVGEAGLYRDEDGFYSYRRVRLEAGE